MRAGSLTCPLPRLPSHVQGVRVSTTAASREVRASNPDDSNSTQSREGGLRGAQHARGQGVEGSTDTCGMHNTRLVLILFYLKELRVKMRLPE